MLSEENGIIQVRKVFWASPVQSPALRRVIFKLWSGSYPGDFWLFPDVEIAQCPVYLSPLQVREVSFAMQSSITEMFRLEGMWMLCVDAPEGTNGREGLHKQHIQVELGRTSQQDPSTSPYTISGHSG